MINLLKTTEPQTIAFIPRVKIDPAQLHIRNETTGAEVLLSPQFYNERYYITANLVFDLNENEFYTITIKSALNEVIYIDTIFCTNQNPADYSINNEKYIYG